MSFPQLLFYSATHNPELFAMVAYTISVAAIFLVVYLYVRRANRS